MAVKHNRGAAYRKAKSHFSMKHKHRKEGLIIKQLRRIPKDGENILFDGYHFIVAESDDLSITIMLA